MEVHVAGIDDLADPGIFVDADNDVRLRNLLAELIRIPLSQTSGNDEEPLPFLLETCKLEDSFDGLPLCSLNERTRVYNNSVRVNRISDDGVSRPFQHSGGVFWQG